MKINKIKLIYVGLVISLVVIVRISTLMLHINEDIKIRKIERNLSDVEAKRMIKRYSSKKEYFEKKEYKIKVQTKGLNVEVDTVDITHLGYFSRN